MSDEKQEKKQEDKTFKVLKVVHRGEAPRYYANNTEVGMTSYDLSLKFAVIEEGDEEALYVKDQAIISMSMHHAKAVAKLLTAYVAQFERNHGLLYSATPEDFGITGDAVAVKVDSNA